LRHNRTLGENSALSDNLLANPRLVVFLERAITSAVPDLTTPVGSENSPYKMLDGGRYTVWDLALTADFLA